MKRLQQECPAHVGQLQTMQREEQLQAAEPEEHPGRASKSNHDGQTDILKIIICIRCEWRGAYAHVVCQSAFEQSCC